MTTTQLRTLQELLKDDNYDIHINLGPSLYREDMVNDDNNRLIKIDHDGVSKNKAFAKTKAFTVNIFNLPSSDILIIRKNRPLPIFEGNKERLVNWNGIIYYKVPFSDIMVGDFAFMVSTQRKCIGMISKIWGKDSDKEITPLVNIWVIRDPIDEMEGLTLVYETDVVAIRPLMSKIK